jgi:hypothetical protein
MATATVHSACKTGSCLPFVVSGHSIVLALLGAYMTPSGCVSREVRPLAQVSCSTEERNDNEWRRVERETGWGNDFAGAIRDQIIMWCPNP